MTIKIILLASCVVELASPVTMEEPTNALLAIIHKEDL